MGKYCTVWGNPDSEVRYCMLCWCRASDEYIRKWATLQSWFISDEEHFRLHFIKFRTRGKNLKTNVESLYQMSDWLFTVSSKLSQNFIQKVKFYLKFVLIKLIIHKLFLKFHYIPGDFEYFFKFLIFFLKFEIKKFFQSVSLFHSKLPNNHSETILNFLKIFVNHLKNLSSQAGYTQCVMRDLYAWRAWFVNKRAYPKPSGNSSIYAFAIRSFPVNKFSVDFQKSVNANFSFGDAQSYRLEKKLRALQCAHRSESTSIHYAQFTNFWRFHA